MAVVIVGKVGHPIDDRAGAVHQLFFLALVDWLIVESSRIQYRLDLGGERVALSRDVGNLAEELSVSGIVAQDRTVGEVEAVNANRAERRVELLVHLRQFDEAFSP